MLHISRIIFTSLITQNLEGGFINSFEYYYQSKKDYLLSISSLSVHIFDVLYINQTYRLPYLYSMPQRRAWTQKEDEILRFLKEQRREKKWSSIAKIMDSQFGMKGRTGKQCRERYHNHLDSSIVSAEWSKQEEKILYDHHQMVGNKWSVIATHLPGRSDNCIKNHFYSRLRKSIRKLNKLIWWRYRGSYEEIKINLLYKIILISEQKFNLNSKVNEEVVEDCNDIKNSLLNINEQDLLEQQNQQGPKQLIQQIHRIENHLKPSHKFKKHRTSIETNASQLQVISLDKESSVKAEDQQLDYYRIIKRVCEEIISSKEK